MAKIYGILLICVLLNSKIVFADEKSVALPEATIEKPKYSLLQNIEEWIFPEDSPVVKIIRYVKSYFSPSKEPIKIAAKHETLEPLTHQKVQDNNTHINLKQDHEQKTQNTSPSIPEVNEQKMQAPTPTKAPSDTEFTSSAGKYQNQPTEIKEQDSIHKGTDTHIHADIVEVPQISALHEDQKKFRPSPEELGLADNEIKLESQNEQITSSRDFHKAHNPISHHQQNNDIIHKTEKELEKHIDKKSRDLFVADLKPITQKQMQAQEAEEAEINAFIQDEVAMIMLPRDDVELGAITSSAKLTYSDESAYIKMFWDQYNKNESKKQDTIIKNFIKAVSNGPVIISDLESAKEEFLSAVEKGDIYTIRTILNHSYININKLTENFKPVLSAVSAGMYNVVYYLIMKGANISVLNDSLSASDFHDNSQKSIIWLLSKAGAKIQY